jgi:glycosyltransferase involved in cell wall biosynthesis
MTQYNNRPTIKQSLDSILNQIDSSFEIIVVDNKSTDGSQEILQEYSNAGKLKLISVRCSRGRGRQIAFENSSGYYIIANLDFDDIFKPRLRELLERYEEMCGEDHLWVRSLDKGGFWGEEGCKIAPRDLISGLGGWRDLQFAEDWELARRAARSGNYRWTYFRLLESTNPHPERKGFIGRMKFRYVNYRDLLRCDFPVFGKGERVFIMQRVPYTLAKLSLPFYEHYYDSDRTFHTTFGPRYYIDFGEAPTNS